MEIQVRVKTVLQPFSYNRKDGTPSLRYSFIGETMEQYPRMICFDVFGDERWREMNIVIGNIYQVSFDVQSREANGRWFTSVTAWRVSSTMTNQPQPQMPPYQQYHQQQQVQQAYNAYQQPQQMPQQQAMYQPQPQQVQDAPF